MRVTDLLRLLLLAAIWGASFLFMRMVAPIMGSMPTAFFRAALGALGLALVLVVMRSNWRFNGKLKYCLGLGLLNAGIPSAMYCLAAQVLPAGYSSILNATTPMMSVLIGGLFFKEALPLSKAAGVALGLFGVFVLTRTGPVEFDLQLVLGAAACLVATACYGFAGFLTRRWLGTGASIDNRLAAFASLSAASLMLLPLMGLNTWIAPPSRWAGWDLWLPLSALGLICTAFAYVLYFRLLNDIGPIKASTTTFLIPLFGILWGALLLDEPLAWSYLYGGGLIALALWLVVKPSTKKASA